jgi:hypothetical protein
MFNKVTSRSYSWEKALQANPFNKNLVKDV